MYRRLYTRRELTSHTQARAIQHKRGEQTPLRNAIILENCLPMTRYTEENATSMLEMAAPKQTSAIRLGRRRVAGLDDRPYRGVAGHFNGMMIVSTSLGVAVHQSAM